MGRSPVRWRTPVIGHKALNERGIRAGPNGTVQVKRVVERIAG